MAREKRSPLNIFGKAWDHATHETRTNALSNTRLGLVGKAFQMSFINTYGKINERGAWMAQTMGDAALDAKRSNTNAVKNPASLLAIINPLNLPLALMRSIRIASNLLIDSTNVSSAAKTVLKMVTGFIPFAIETVLSPFTEFPRSIPATIMNQREHAALVNQLQNTTDPTESSQLKTRIALSERRDPSLEQSVKAQSHQVTRSSMRMITESLAATPAKNAVAFERDMEVVEMDEEESYADSQHDSNEVEVIGVGIERDILGSKSNEEEINEEKHETPRPNF